MVFTRVLNLWSTMQSARFRIIGFALVYLMSLFFICEFVIYYTAILKCEWPNFVDTNNDKPLNVMIIADTHLLGFRNGHWFDKLRREWQMYRSFQTLMWKLKPNLVFFLGDLFDEGLWATDEQFKSYFKRFYSLFHVPASTKVYVVPGNHDIGFHYSITPKLNRRFIEAFNSPPVDLVIEEEITFVLVNSMAMERDGCFLCEEAKTKLDAISQDLNCAKKLDGDMNCPKVKLRLPIYSRPVLLQHFPLYRISDENCSGPDVAPPPLKSNAFAENWDCLSKSSSELLLNKLNPRLVFSGHIHYGCTVLHNDSIPEYSVPSFSWRNINNPSAILLRLTPEDYYIDKCFLPMESTVINLYLTGVVLPVVLGIVSWIIRVINNRNKLKKRY